MTKEESEKGLHLWMMEDVSANMIELPDGVWEDRKKQLNDYMIMLCKKYDLTGKQCPRFDFKNGRILQ
jgi:hypothetical protein